MIRSILVDADRYDPSFGVLVRLAVSTGLRRAELCGLQWDDAKVVTNATQGKQNDSGTPPYWGGHGIRNTSGTTASCSLGVPVNSSTQPGGHDYYLTAGHCLDGWSSPVWHGNQGTIGDRVAWLFPGSGGKQDFGLADGDDLEIWALQWKHTTNNTYYTQKGTATPSNGDFICNSGARYETLRCGTVWFSSADFANINDSGIGHYDAHDVVEVGNLTASTQSGDSGSGWFEINSPNSYAYIDGVHSFAGGSYATAKFVKWSNRPGGWGLSVATK
jgi:hypothetical protein